MLRPPTPHRYDWRERFTHRFRYPGTYYAVLHVQHQCEGPDGEVARAVRIVVRPGRNLANGPALPTVNFVPEYGVTDSFFVSAFDADGFPRRVDVDWGDGSARETHAFSYADCDEPRWQWPSSEPGARFRHHYATPGGHHVTVRVTSYGCNGHDRQRATATFTA